MSGTLATLASILNSNKESNAVINVKKKTSKGREGRFLTDTEWRDNVYDMIVISDLVAFPGHVAASYGRLLMCLNSEQASVIGSYRKQAVLMTRGRLGSRKEWY